MTDPRLTECIKALVAVIEKPGFGWDDAARAVILKWLEQEPSAGELRAAYVAMRPPLIRSSEPTWVGIEQVFKAMRAQAAKEITE